MCSLKATVTHLTAITSEGSSTWRCVRRDCVGRRKKLVDGSFIEITGHVHGPDNAKNDAEKMKAEMRHRAVTTVKQPRQIIHKSHDVYLHCCQLMEPDRFLTICEEYHTTSTFKVFYFNILHIWIDFVIAFMLCCFMDA